IPQKPWTEVEKDFAVYSATFRESNGREAPQPLAAAFLCVDEDAGRAEEMAQRYIGDYYHSVMKHYELTAGHLANTKGYDFYHRVGKHIERHGADHAAQQFVELMPYGTPEQVLEKVRRIHRHIGNAGLLATFSFGGMPYDVAERSLRLFSKEVLPELKKFEVGVPAFAESA
ncbi:MAG TPA: LLM class flavin-dependent oxidoreductase, partial [bacterium]